MDKNTWSDGSPRWAEPSLDRPKADGEQPEQVAKLLTAVIRNNRGCEGYLEGAIDSGAFCHRATGERIGEFEVKRP
jgi:hypothetical protein